MTDSDEVAEEPSWRIKLKGLKEALVMLKKLDDDIVLEKDVLSALPSPEATMLAIVAEVLYEAELIKEKTVSELKNGTRIAIALWEKGLRGELSETLETSQ